MGVQETTVQTHVRAPFKRWYWYLLILGIVMIGGGIAGVLLL